MLMEFLNVVSCLSFVAAAQNLIVVYRLPVPEYSCATETPGRKKKRHDRRVFVKKIGNPVYHRRLCREYENYRKD